MSLGWIFFLLGQLFIEVLIVKMFVVDCLTDELLLKSDLVAGLNPGV
jgi:hypothetical protein